MRHELISIRLMQSSESFQTCKFSHILTIMSEIIITKWSNFLLLNFLLLKLQTDKGEKKDYKKKTKNEIKIASNSCICFQKQSQLQDKQVKFLVLWYLQFSFYEFFSDCFWKEVRIFLNFTWNFFGVNYDNFSV